MARVWWLWLRKVVKTFKLSKLLLAFFQNIKYSLFFFIAKVRHECALRKNVNYIKYSFCLTWRVGFSHPSRGTCITLRYLLVKRTHAYLKRWRTERFSTNSARASRKKRKSHSQSNAKCAGAAIKRKKRNKERKQTAQEWKAQRVGIGRRPTKAYYLFSKRFPHFSMKLDSH